VASANVELLRRIFERWEQGDFSSADWADPDIEYVQADGAETGSFHGRAEMAEAWRSFLSAWQGLRAEAEEYRELDDSTVLVLVRNSGLAPGSGMDLETLGAQGANLFTIRQGKVVRLALYWDRRKALADLGLGP
jgi:ketosteroid isomerase-like protein